MKTAMLEGNASHKPLSCIRLKRKQSFLDFKVGFVPLLFVTLLIISFQIVENYAFSPNPESSNSCIYFKVIDANTDKPIQNATVIFWDLFATTYSPRLLFTDDEGISYSEVTREHPLWLYAYKGNLTEGVIEYAPQKVETKLSYSENSRNVTFRLVPAAAVHFIGEISLVESVGPPNTFTVYIVDPKLPGNVPPALNGSFIHTYDSTTRWFLKEKKILDKNFVFVPAGISVSLKFDIRLPESRNPISFSIAVSPLTMGSQTTFRLEESSLKRSIETVTEYVLNAYSKLDDAQNVGFYLAEERRTLDEQLNATGAARDQLSRGDEEGYRQCWETLRDAYIRTSGILVTLDQYVLLSAANAVYLPAFFAVYSVIFAFFIFENDRKKIISSFIFYGSFTAILFAVYPGIRIIVSQNIELFAGVAVLSILVALGTVFLINYRWKLSMEGLFSLRDIIATLFSLGKRQIKIRKARGFLTISSLIILVLAFTSLTSFGWVYGITSEKIPYTSNVEGFLVKRTANETFAYGQSSYPLFIPLDVGYYLMITQLLTPEYVAPKIETYPSQDPIASLISERGETADIRGVVGIKPASEILFTKLNEIIPVGGGNYLDEEDLSGILISDTAATALNVRAGETVRLLSSEGTVRVALNCTIRGIFRDSGFEQLKEIDGQPFGPKCVILRDGKPVNTVCNATNVVIMNWQAAISLQSQINVQQKKEEGDIGRFNSLSRVAFRTQGGYGIERVVETVINGLYCDAYVSEGGVVSRYYIGYYYEAKGAVEIIFPLVMASLNVGAVMLNAVYERRKEMRILTVIGSNPSHLAMLFISEALILGMVGGGLGYLFGLGFYRIMPLLGTGLMVREKIEWWWSALGFGLAILASVLSTLRPALLAIKMYTPSKIRKIKVSEEEEVARREEILKVYQARSITMPVKVSERDAIFFFSFLFGHLQDLRGGVYERITDLQELPETQTSKGHIIKRVRFDHVAISAGGKIMIKNEVVCSKNPDEDYYRVQLVSNLDNIEVSEDHIYRIVGILRDIVLDWLRNKEKFIGSI